MIPRNVGFAKGTQLNAVGKRTHIELKKLAEVE